MIFFFLALYIGIGVGITLVRDEYYDAQEFVLEVVGWPMVLLEWFFDDFIDWVFDAFDTIFERFFDFIDAIFEQVGDIFDWMIDNTIGLFDRQTIRSGKGSVNIQANGDLDIHEDFDGNINIQARGRGLRKNKKKVKVKELSEADLLKKNPLE